jgi:type IV pilus assembly protein PilY1
MNETTTRRKIKRSGASIIAATLLLQTIPAHAVVSQLPGLYVKPPASNVMLTLDNSGSMRSDVIPDYPNAASGLPTNANSSAISIPGSKHPGMWQNNSSYWAPTYYNINNAAARYMRSSAGNPLYYNPKIRYRPWPLATDDTKFQADADPTKVNIHYAYPSTTTTKRDITKQVTTTGSGSGSFWPATYFVYKGSVPLTLGDPTVSALNVATNFDKYEIQPSISSYSKGTGRTDCLGTTCTYAEEIQNFANWLQYYRSRMLAAKGGVASAFAAQGNEVRVGLAVFATPPVVTGPALKLGVLPFSAVNRTNFYNTLYTTDANYGTPTRKVLDEIGQYFQRSNPGNPWSEDPSSSTSVGIEYSCRKSFNIVTTDGFWSTDTANPPANGDNDDFSAQKTPPRGPATGPTYDYSDSTLSSPTDPLVTRFGISPYNDEQTPALADTLADVAAYYWKTDLRPTLNNDVEPSKRDPAFWQHLTTYAVGMGVNGTGSVKRKVDGSKSVPLTEPPTSPFFPYLGKPWLSDPTLRDLLISTRTALKWPVVTADTPETGDDLIHASMNGRGQYFSASNPAEMAAGLKAALAEATSNPGSLANVVTSSPQVSIGTAVYQATYTPADWSGRFYAFPQAANGSVDTTPANALWEASNKMPTPASRNIYTWNPSLNAGRSFTWANLTSTQQADLGNDTTLLDYLRGSDAKEIARGGTWRDRARNTIGSVQGGVLGDIVNGSPIKGPSAGNGYDRLPAGTPGQASYATYRSAGNTALDNMRNTLFVAANDGMLHAFDRANGVERFAFVPNSVFSVPRSPTSTEKKLALLADPGYTHRFTVDGPPQIGDAYFGPTAASAFWRTVLLGTTGAGARSVFAMDITNPTVALNGFDQSKLMWEFSETNNADMGYVPSYPHIARMRDGTWVAIFGNGYDSTNGQAKLFVLNLQTGAVLWEQSVGAAGGNGLSQPNFTLNANREVTAIYAGDLKGNLWKFDVDDANPVNWKVAFGTGPSYEPLFAPSVANLGKQPIAVMPELTFHPNGGVMVSFGTGKLFEVEDTASTVPPNVNRNIQAIYGIWDKPSATAGFSGNTALVQQTANSTLAARTGFGGTTTATINWATQRGWYLNLNAGGERVNVNLFQAKSSLLVVANTPDSDPCKSGGSSRFFSLDPITGGAPSFAVFDSDGSGGISNADKGYNVKLIAYAVLSLPALQTKTSALDQIVTERAGARGQTGERTGGVENKTPSTTDCKQWALAGSSNATIAGFDIALCAAGKPRVSWRQLK